MGRANFFVVIEGRKGFFLHFYVFFTIELSTGHFLNFNSSTGQSFFFFTHQVVKCFFFTNHVGEVFYLKKLHARPWLSNGAPLQ